MELCSDGHNEVCYEGGVCPVCVKQEEVESLESLVSQLETELNEVKEQKKPD